MSTLYRVEHRTMYRYDQPVEASYGLLHMLPRDLAGQRCHAAEVRVSPRPDTLAERIDFFGNRVTAFALHEPHHALEVTVVSTVEVEDRAAELSLFAERSWESVRDGVHSAGVDPEICQYLLDSPLVELRTPYRDYARESFVPGAGIVEAVGDLTHRIYDDFHYAPGVTTVTTPLEEVFARRTGVCQDLAHVEIACLRGLGIPARYVSGYLETEPPPGRPRLAGVDGSHAWLSVYVPETGWMAVDPTNDSWVSGRYVTTAVGRDYSDVPPMQGIIFSDGSTESLEVQVDVVALARSDTQAG